MDEIAHNRATLHRQPSSVTPDRVRRTVPNDEAAKTPVSHQYVCSQAEHEIRYAGCARGEHGVGELVRSGGLTEKISRPSDSEGGEGRYWNVSRDTLSADTLLELGGR